MNIANKIAQELNIKSAQVTTVMQLFTEGATVPFIARYRKEATGGLTDTQLRLLEERLQYLSELEERRQTILKSISEQNKLTPELEKNILACDNKAQLEDLYLPYKPKRHTKAQIARAAGLEPLALKIWQEPTHSPETLAESFLNSEKNINTTQDALEGARQILMELFAENADIIGQLREYVWQNAILKSEVQKNKEQEGNKFKDYFNYEEAIKNIPSHRALAVLRGRNEEMLQVKLILPPQHEQTCLSNLLDFFNINNKNRPADLWLLETINLTWRIKLFFKLETDLMLRLRDNAEQEAIKVFANNLKNLLLAAPAGSRVTLGLDPGLRTGVKAVVVDATGKLLDKVTVFPHVPHNDWDKALYILSELCNKHQVDLISIGNGTASRETDKLVQALKKKNATLSLTSIVVSEAGASVYSASEFAAKEFPDLDVSYRGAVSIARRLQDPLAELIKIDPKAIGVGQYQHDVNQLKLSRALHAVMEDCVNAVGVDINTASLPLLSCVAGLNESVAKNIIRMRDDQGVFKNRIQLKKVPRMGEKTFEQAAGFLRVVNGENPLDASAVHPEAYHIVERIMQQENKSVKEIMGNVSFIKKLKPENYADANFGIPTITDIFKELEKPGRDPRPEFKAPNFKENIESMTDLKPNMILEGVVTNVANFGAFVDIGVHQDGLVHKSLLANHYVKDPATFLKVGDIVTVKVIEVDLERKRIQLSMKLDESAKTNTPSSSQQNIKRKKSSQPENAFTNAFKAAWENSKK